MISTSVICFKIACFRIRHNVKPVVVFPALQGFQEATEPQGIQVHREITASQDRRETGAPMAQKEGQEIPDPRGYQVPRGHQSGNSVLGRT